MGLLQFGFLLLLCFVLTAGCGNRVTLPVNGKSRKELRISSVVGHVFLQDSQFAGSVSAGSIEVLYEEGLKDQAQCIAHLTDKSFRHIHNSTGLRTSTAGRTVYLLWKKYSVLDASQIVWTPKKSLGLILFAPPNNNSCESIVSQNSVFPFTFYHEIVEGTLINRKEGTAIEHDYRTKEFVFFNRSILNYTRWFREGFSTYCAYLAHEAIISDELFDKSSVSHSMLLNGCSLHPFSALSKIGNDMFRWHQFSRFPGPLLSSPNLPNPEQTIIDYYDASFGLFLLIRDQFGEDAIARVIRGIDTLERADGPALIKLTNAVLDTDIEQLAEDFCFPKTGLYMEPLFPGQAEHKGLSISEGLFVTVVEEASSAEKAGIRKNDVIYRINDRDVKTNLDFELAIFEFMHEPSVTINVFRDKEGEIVTELRLDN